MNHTNWNAIDYHASVQVVHGILYCVFYNIIGIQMKSVEEFVYVLPSKFYHRILGRDCFTNKTVLQSY
jgi:hypothetical protein